LLPNENKGDASMTLEDRVHAFRLHVFSRAEELGNVSAACRELGISRSLYYRFKKRHERYGADGLHPKRTRGRPGRPPQLAAHEERAVIALALAQPAFGPQRISDQLVRQGIQVAPCTVYRALRRHRLGTRAERLVVLERHSAVRAGLLTERTRRAIEKARPMPSSRHVEARVPGELVCLDSFYIGKLKGVGKVWQITACDAATSYGLARVFAGEPSSEVSAAFLRERIVPEFAQAGWKLRRVLTDGGSEFKAVFQEACRELGVRHTRTKPRHAWTNGFVERLQGTILHEHWRVEFRRRYFTRLAHLETSLQSYLRFYNHERTHRGYRTRGRTPGELVWGVTDVRAR
jgi:transposase InsO family protein